MFARALNSTAQPGDVAIGISTSGASENVIRGLQAATDADMFTVGLGGRDGGDLPSVCDMTITIPIDDTARIQEGHELCGHLICACVERALFRADA